MKVSTEILRKIIKEELLQDVLHVCESPVIMSEQPAEEESDDSKVSNADVIKKLKGGAADIAAAVPPAMNDEILRALESLTAMAQHDKANFEKVVTRIDALSGKSLEKVKEG